MKLTKILSAVLLLSSLCYGGQWINFFANAKVTCQAVEGQYLWIGTEKYLSKLNTLTGEVTEVYSLNYCSSIAVDQQGNKWIGTNAGLFKFDGQGMTKYNTGNSGLPGSYVRSVAVDPQGNKWIGVDEGKLVKYEGQNWTEYPNAVGV
ncbi:MAG: hypothetical protein ACM3P0_11550 [Acidobacteriota bacterium]